MDYKKIKEQAKEEVRQEQANISKEILKDKYRDLSCAKLVVKNIEIEIEDIIDQIDQGNVPCVDCENCEIG